MRELIVFLTLKVFYGAPRHDVMPCFLNPGTFKCIERQTALDDYVSSAHERLGNIAPFFRRYRRNGQAIAFLQHTHLF